MRKIALGLALAMICAQAQPFQDLLLPQVRHIVGVVVDAEGKLSAELVSTTRMIGAAHIKRTRRENSNYIPMRQRL